jgi:ethanolamine transporter EutH
MKLDWQKYKSKIPIAIVCFTVYFYFSLFKRSAVNGLPIFAKENLIFVSIGTVLMIVVGLALYFITNLYDDFKKKKDKDI